MLGWEAGRGAIGGTRVSAVDAQGGAWARGDAEAHGAGAKARGLKKTSVAADDLRLALTQDAVGKDQPEALTGAGHTRIEQRTADGTVQTSAGDALEARFTGQEGHGFEIASAKQTGNVQIRSVSGKPGEQASEGVAERAEFDGASNVLTLTTPQRASSLGSPIGRPRLTQGETSMAAETIRIMQQTGDAMAEGSVAGTLVDANAKAGAPVTHVMAAEAVLHKAAETMELKGTDAAPARMWQGASQVQAANILLDRNKDEMQAWPAGASGVVRAVFAEQGGKAENRDREQRWAGNGRQQASEWCA